MKFSQLKRLTDVLLIAWVGPDERDCAVAGFDAEATAARMAKAEKARNSAKARWAANANASSTHSERNAAADANAMRQQSERNAVAHARQRTSDNVRDPSLHSAVASGASALETAPGSSTPVVRTTEILDATAAPAGMPEYPPLPTEPPDYGRPDQRRPPPRQQERTGYAVPGSTPAPPAVCSRCRRSSSALTWSGVERLCDACRRPRGELAGADEARALAASLAAKRGPA